MIKSALLLVFVIFGASSVANAACEKGTKTVFRCLAASGKQIQVCDSGRTIDYSFGKPGLPPEIIVRAPRTEAYTIPWNGMGRILFCSDSERQHYLRCFLERGQNHRRAPCLCGSKRPSE